MVLAPFFFGSVDLFWIATWVIVLSFAAAIGLALDIDARQRRVLVIFLLGCLLFALVVAIQYVPNPLTGLDDPVWADAKALGIPVHPRIAASAVVPPQALGHFLLFAAAVVNGFLAGTSRRSSVSLVSVARYALLGYVIYGLAALVLTPGMLLWAPKTAYQTSLTSTFVNHNTAATFIGIGAILWFSVTLSKSQEIKFTSWRMMLMSRSTEEQALGILLYAAVTALCVFALFRTGSRAGLICSVFGMLVTAILIYARRRASDMRRVVFVTAGCLAVVLLLGRTGDIASKGLFDGNRWQVYSAVIDAICARPWLGYGLGSFPDVFPMLRGDDFYSWGVWSQAHSTVLKLAFEMGVPAALLIDAAILAAIVMVCRAALRASERSNIRLAAIAGIMIAGVTHALVDFSFQIPGYMVVYGILAGCGLANAARLPTPPAQSTSGTSASKPAQLTSDSALLSV